MEDRPRSLPVRLLSSLWLWVDEARRFAVNVLFLGILVGLVAVAIAGRPRVPKGAALVVKPQGVLVEQLSRPSADSVVEAALLGERGRETLVKDLLDAVTTAKDDTRIGAIFLDVSQMTGGGLTKIEELRAGLVDFRKSGKKVIAYGDLYLQGPYAVAAAADEVWLHPDGAILFEGFGRWRTYYKDAIDRLGIDWHVFRVGEYKSYVEPFLRNEPSPEAREADRKWLSDLWSSWVKDASGARNMSPDDVRAYIDRMPERLEAAKGSLAKIALEAKLVDKLGYRDEVRKRMFDLVGEEKSEKTFKQVSVADYLEAKGGDRTGKRGGGDAVAVVVAVGNILDGKQPPGTIGGDSTAALIRKARQDDKVKAIVLRVDSPGGSVFGSETIRRELALARSVDSKPVVVSMGSVAASGGYWISTASDEIWASPDTITGSIGIFGMFPTVEKPLAKYLGMRVDGVGTTWLSGAIRPDRALNPEAGRIIQLSIDHGYEEFLMRVAEARKMPMEDVDRIARGRVWSGADAFERKLVDKLGGLPEAILSAAKMAKLPEKKYRVWYVEKEMTFKEKLLADFLDGRAHVARTLGFALDEPEPPAPPFAIRAVLDRLGETAKLLSFNDPGGVYAYCACEVK
ncbi:MAG: signal peptide peptidase SppA [Thermoanaerobaculia bacterium]